MATTENLLNGNGSQDTFSFTFPYLKDTDIKVSVGGIVKTVTTHYTLHNATTIKFTSGNIPPSGTENVRIYRETDDTSLKATFYPGSAIRAGDLNDNATQGLYVVQETNNTVKKAWTKGDDTVDSTETWHTSDDTKVGTTKAIENRINSQIDTALENDVLAGTDLAKTASGGQVTINHSVGGADTTVNNSNGNVLQDITISAQGHVTSIGSVNLDGRYYTETEADTNFQPKDAELTELATMGSTTAAALADLTQAEVQILDGATVTTDELNILDGVTATATELNIIDGVTATTTELNILDGITATTTELNILDGVTATTTELNILDGVTATTDELNKLDGVTATTTELNKTDGLTSTPTELNILDGATVNTSELNKLDGVTASTTELNIVAGKTFKTSTGTLDTTSDTEIPSSKVIAAHVASSQTAIGGFVTIADEESFPNTQPANGIVVSINNAAGVAINGSGVSTTGRRLDDTTVTINGFPSSLYGETLAAGVGLLVTATSTANTYTYHKILSSETDVKQLSDDINDFNSRYRIASSAPGSNNDEGDLYFDTSANKMKVYNGSAWDDVASVGSFYINTLSGSSGANGNESGNFDGTAKRFTLSNPPSGGAQQLIVSVNGVIQKPNSGTSPSEGFAVDGNDILFAAAPAASSDFFIITQGSSVSIGTPSASSVNSSHIIDGSIVNADISSSAAIAQSKLAIGGSDGIDFNDAAAVRWGTDNDLTIKHDSNNQIIAKAGSETNWIYDSSTIWTVSNAGVYRVLADTNFDNGNDVYIRSDGELRFREALANGNAYVGITAPTDKGSDASYTITLPSAAPTSNGQVLSATTAGAASWINAGGGAVVDLVADGAIAAGKPVILTAAGKVKQTAAPYSNLSDIETAASQFTYTTNTDGGMSPSNGQNQGWAYGEVTKTIQHVYRFGSSGGASWAFWWDADESSYLNKAGYSMLPYDDHWNNHEYQCITYCGSVASGTKDMFVAAWLDSDNDNLLARVGINGTAGSQVSWSSKFNIESSGDARTYRQSIAWDEDNERVIVAYKDTGDSEKGKVRVGTITSTDSFAGGSNCTITWGSETTFNDDTTGQIAAIYDKTANKVVISFVDEGDSNNTKAIVGTVASSGNSITFGTAVSYNGTDTAGDSYLVYDPDAGRVGFTYKHDGDSSHMYTQSAVVSGTGTDGTITFGTAVELFDQNTNGHAVAYDTSTNTHILNYTKTNNDNYVKSFEINNSTGAIENLGSGDGVEIDTSNAGHGGIIATGDNGRVIVRHGNGKMRALWTQKATTNITGNTGAGSVLGFVDTAVSDGATATVKLTGNVTTGQSGLTVGTKYYIKADGTLGTAWDSGLLTDVVTANTPYAGIAIAADKIVIGDLNKTIAS